MQNKIFDEVIIIPSLPSALADQRSRDEGLARHPKDVRPAQLEGGSGCCHDLRSAWGVLFTLRSVAQLKCNTRGSIKSFFVFVFLKQCFLIIFNKKGEKNNQTHKTHSYEYQLKFQLDLLLTNTIQREI